MNKHVSQFQIVQCGMSYSNFTITACLKKCVVMVLWITNRAEDLFKRLLKWLDYS